jgi:sortase (surface protein transpeptidase)
LLNELESPKSEEKEKNAFLNWFIFLTKYIITSVFIFWILLVSTNYSAYYNIVKSYVYQEELEIESKWIISSVEASNIKEKFKEQIEEENELIKNEGNEKTADYSIKKLVNISNKNDISLNIEITPYENRIIIPKIWQNIPLIDIVNKKIEWEEELNNIFMQELENWVIRYPSSSTPWEDWTTFIFWHSSNFPWIKWDYNDVFSLLDKVEFEDEIIIYYNQKKYIYKIREKRVITPWDVSVLERNKKKSELTLMTCWPLWTTLNRLIVVWEIIKE